MNKTYKNIYFIILILNLILVAFNSISFADESNINQVQITDTYYIHYSDHSIDSPTVDIRISDTDNYNDHLKTNLDGDSSQSSAAISAPVVEFMDELIEKAQIKVKMTSESVICKDCEFSLSTQIENTCNEQNNYLKQQLKSEAVVKVLNIPSIQNSHFSIKESCILASQKTTLGEKQKTFAQCQIGDLKIPKKKTIRPCIDNEYLNFTTHSFNLAAQCMTNKPFEAESIFGMMNVESGFHANAVSGTGSSGIGQLTSAAIKDINMNELAGLKDNMIASENTQCQTIANEFLSNKNPIRSDRKYSCDRVSIEKGNPLLNMIYTFAYVQKTKKDLDKFFFKQFEKSFNLSDEELNKLKLELSIWGHNTGIMGLLVPMKILMKKYQSARITDRTKFLEELAIQMTKTPASANRSRSRRRETSNYFPKIQERLALIKNDFAGGSCIH